MVMGMANLAMATGNIGRDGVGVNPLRGQNNVQGSCDMGSFPHELSGYRHVSDDAVREVFEQVWGATHRARAGPAHPEHVRRRDRRHVPRRCSSRARTSPSPTRTPQHVDGRALRDGPARRAGPVPQRDREFAHVFLPGTSFLEKDGTFTNAERRINRVRPVMAAQDRHARSGRWSASSPPRMGYPMHYDDVGQIMDEIAALTPTFAGVSFEQLDELGSIQWPCNDAAPDGTRFMHVDAFVRGKGRFVETPYVPTDERTTRKFPLILTTGRILSQYNVGAQTRRTANVVWHDEDVLEIHPHDAEVRGIADGDWVTLTSRVGETTLQAQDRRPDAARASSTRRSTTRSAGANVVTTEYSDWATNCPEYKVTAVQVAVTSAPDRVPVA